MPKVSIIVPVYNAEKTISRCIDSILGQEFHDFELILVDDGSTDASPNILESYATKDGRIHAIHKQNAGVSNARNTGLDHARGHYVQFLDADDWITPDATKLLVRAMEENDVDMVIADFYRVIGERVARKGNIDFDSPITREDYADLMLESPADFYWGVLWNKLYRRDIIEKYHLRMDPDVSWSEDFIFNMEYVLHTHTIYPLHAPVYYYVKTEGSLVESSSGIANTVRMKMSVIEYYKAFYQQVYDDQSYEVRRADIYRFLVNFATDGNATPGMPSTKRLGEERGVRESASLLEDGTVSRLYYGGLLLDRSLASVAARFDLTLRDVKAFAFVKYAGAIRDREEVGQYAGLSGMSLATTFSKLSVRGFLKSVSLPKEEQAQPTDPGATRGPRRLIRLGDKSDDLSAAVDQAVSDYQRLLLRGLSKDERDALAKLLEKLAANARDAIL